MSRPRKMRRSRLSYEIAETARIRAAQCSSFSASFILWLIAALTDFALERSSDSDRSRDEGQANPVLLVPSFLQEATEKTERTVR